MKRMLSMLLVLCLLFPASSLALTEDPSIVSPYNYPVGNVTVTISSGADSTGPSPNTTGNPVNVTNVPGQYKKGSVYGPKLSAKELAQVKTAAVIKAVNTCIREGMTDGEKVVALVNNLCDVCAYAPDWSKNKATTAWGALVYGEAQCSGYARAMVALCDAVGIECKYVHASKAAINPSHQWVVVKYQGQWYHLDPQMIDDYMLINTTTGQISYPRPIVLMASYLPYETKGIPKTASADVKLR